MKILSKDEAAALVSEVDLTRKLREHYVLVERPSIRDVTLEGDKVFFDGIPVFSRADVQSIMDLTVHSAQVEDALVRYLEYAASKEAVDLAVEREEFDWVHKRRNEVAKEMGYEYMYAPSGIKTLIHRLATAEYKNMVHGEEIK